MIVPVTFNNIDDCIYIFLDSYNQAPWNYHWTYENAKQYLSEYLDTKQFTGFILYDDNKPVGAIFCHTKTWWTNKQLMVDEFFVSRAKQGMGYGKTLLEECHRYAMENNIESVVLMTNKYMPAFSFYNKLGYTTTEQYVFMFKQVPLKETVHEHSLQLK